MRQSWETMTSVSAGHIILTPTQPVGSDLRRSTPKKGADSRVLHTEGSVGDIGDDKLH